MSETTKRTYTGKHRVAPLLTRKQKDAKTYFTIREAASLVNKTSVRLFQLIQEGVIESKNVAKEGSTNARHKIPRSELKKLLSHFGLQGYFYAPEPVEVDQTEVTAEAAG